MDRTKIDFVIAACEAAALHRAEIRTRNHRVLGGHDGCPWNLGAAEWWLSFVPLSCHGQICETLYVYGRRGRLYQVIVTTYPGGHEAQAVPVELVEGRVFAHLLDEAHAQVLREIACRAAKERQRLGGAEHADLNKLRKGWEYI